MRRAALLIALMLLTGCASDRALLLVDFPGSLRRSELVAIELEDLRFEQRGVVLTIRHSKTDQEGAGVQVGLPQRPDLAIDPVRALRAWLDAAAIEGDPVFRSFSMRGSLQARRLGGRDVARTCNVSRRPRGSKATWADTPLNRPLEDWPKLFGHTPTVGAFLDRLMHHGHLIEIRGKSYRLHVSSLTRSKRAAIRAPLPG